MGEPDWTGYLDAFHRQRPGITEVVLGRAFDDAGANPYEWMVESLAGEGPVLDPLRRLVATRSI